MLESVFSFESISPPLSDSQWNGQVLLTFSIESSILAPMETVWVIGAGRFGLRAAKYLQKQHNGFQVVLVDQDQKKLDQARELGCIKEHADGIAYLNAHLKSEKLPAWIVPALPVHLAWQWCRRQLEPMLLTQIDIPGEIDGLLPNPMRGQQNDIYVSHADFICPENCSEPHDICTVTKQMRKQDMYKLLSKLRLNNFSSLVIQSLQLGPGVGGYSPGDLFSLLGEIEKKILKGPFLVSTACRCHGVITGSTFN